MKILVTGAAGFIGFFTARRLLDLGHEVVGLDNLNDYYDPALKRARLAQLEGRNGFHFIRADLADRPAIEALFRAERPQRVVHLAAQAGVRHSLTHPHVYIASNVTGFLHILEGCRHHGIEHLVYASSSSVYGANSAMPFSVHHNVDHPLSLYAATKKSNELMAHSYAHLYRLPVTGLRFFTVYGPWGRPDMALFTFTKKIFAGEPIEVFNHGRHARLLLFGGHEQDRNLAALFPVFDGPGFFGPGHQGHHHVEEDEVGGATAVNEVVGIDAAVRGRNLEAGIGEKIADHGESDRAIIDHDNVLIHYLLQLKQCYEYL
jgi:nucleoside-diphosphate-sugar epimerase